ncbi:ABC transporter permease [Dichotomicrobium thermohalophilum]|uniref:Osmoprotectant transport system permease protein n=1 Tax=Dichotomicrobium thermohalophilum TaxID=933063 RepID=A0A397Q5V2_9HYPH|nr:ABC transporter permease [Dichotomicrobium thermohalophilum]RIA56870.1 osmoprotectant transport system permease protein [Dichotomicrobium thermohalophilum]
MAVIGAARRTTTGRIMSWLVVLGAFGLGIVVSSSGLLEDFILYWPDIEFLFQQHVRLVAISGGLAIVAGVTLGILLSRPFMARFAEYFMQIFNVGTTIPTLAILALSMSFLGIGTLPAIFGLFIASLLPIVRNTYAGLKAVPDHLKEAASGMGMAPGTMLLKVELPNALYVIFAGIRTALTINVGTVPLAFLIGGGGLGELIFTGIALNEFGMMLAGAIPTALLAIVVDFVMAQIQYWVIPRGVNPQR